MASKQHFRVIDTAPSLRKEPITMDEFHAALAQFRESAQRLGNAIDAVSELFRTASKDPSIHVVVDPVRALPAPRKEIETSQGTVALLR